MKRFIALLLTVTMTVGLTVSATATDTIVIEGTGENKETVAAPTSEPTTVTIKGLKYKLDNKSKTATLTGAKRKRSPN